MTQFTIAIFDFHIVALYSKSYPIKFTLYQQKISILVSYAHLTMRNGCQPVFQKKKKTISGNYSTGSTQWFWSFFCILRDLPLGNFRWQSQISILITLQDKEYLYSLMYDNTEIGWSARFVMIENQSGVRI